MNRVLDERGGRQLRVKLFSGELAHAFERNLARVYPRPSRFRLVEPAVGREQVGDYPRFVFDGSSDHPRMSVAFNGQAR